MAITVRLPVQKEEPKQIPVAKVEVKTPAATAPKELKESN